MAYEPAILRRAVSRLQQQAAAHRRMKEQEQAQLYEKYPRLGEIDLALRQTIVGVAAAAFRRDVPPEQEVARLRQENQSLQEERAALLKGLGLPRDAGELTPKCPCCGDTGWVGAKMCSCLSLLCAQEQIKELSSMLDLQGQSFETFSLDYYPNEVWPELGQSPRQCMAVTLDICRQYAGRFPGFPIKNLFFYGKPGLGKTFLSACIAREVSRRGYSVVYDTAVHIFSQYEAVRFARDEDAAGALRRYERCDLLILDDLGSEMTSPLFQSALYTLVNSRLIGRKHTIISSNLGERALADRYSAQIISRLRGEYETIFFDGNDIRQLKRGRMPN